MPAKVSKPPGKEKKKKTEHAPAPVVVQAHDDEDFYREPIKRIVKPENQLVLTDEQLADEITKVLTANDPNVPNNTTKYNYKEKAFKQDPEGPMDNLAFHMQFDGSALYKESEDAKTQIAYEEENKAEAERMRKEAVQEAQDAGEEDVEVNFVK